MSSLLDWIKKELDVGADLHGIFEALDKEIGALKADFEAMKDHIAEHMQPMYEPDEYPKMVNGVIVHAPNETESTLQRVSEDAGASSASGGSAGR
jgi:hypothetical protein